MGKALLTLVLFVLAAPLGSAQDQPAAEISRIARANEIIRLAKTALGGEENLDAVKSLQINGDLLIPVGARQVKGNLKIDMILPDRYLRTTKTVIGQMEMTRLEAVNGEDVWSDNKRSTLISPDVDSMAGGRSRGMGGGGINGEGGMGGGAGSGMGRGGGMSGGMRGGSQARRPGADSILDISPEARAAIERQIRGDYSRIMLALLLSSPNAHEFSFSYENELETKGGKVDVLKVLGPDGFAMWMMFDQKTHLPWMMNFASPAARSPRGQQSEDENGEPKMVDVQLFFADHRQEGKLLMPHRIVKATNGQTIEEWTLKKFKFNPNLKPGNFEKKAK
ncbi:MAG: hypothetical protein IPM66_12280 [Acidobacteriota bacterium]|nr:MAG: hypothetical protein IPM66_12280 [Acidobacteriota bacterium]